MALNERAARHRSRARRERPARSPRGAGERPRAWCAGQAAGGRGARRARRALQRRSTEQIDRRVRGLKISDRLVSLADPDARPIRKGKLGRPTEFGYVAQLCEVTENTRPGARGLILPAAHAPGNPAENRLLPQTAAELDAGRDHGCARSSPMAASMPRRRRDAFPDLARRADPALRPSRTGLAERTRKRRARYRTGIEGRISHLKRGYGLRRSRLKGHEGMRTWTGWAILAYDLDTLAIRTR